MKIICNRNELIKAINIVMKAVPVRTTMPVLECILVDASAGQIRLTGNDMELGIETGAQGVILEKGLIAIDAKIFSEIVRKLPEGEVTIESDENLNTTISCAKAMFRISAMDGEDFARIPAVERTHPVLLSQFTLKELIRQTLFSIAQNDTNKIMTGELFEITGDHMRVVSLDGHRISIRRIEMKEENPDVKVIVPGKTLNEISKILSGETADMMNLYFTKNHVMFEFDDTIVVSRLIEGSYFKVDQMLSTDYETKITINRREMLECIDRSTLLVKEDDKKPIILGITQDHMDFSIQSQIGSMNESISIDMEGRDLRIGFNPKYLIDALRVIDDETVDIYYVNSKAPCFIRDADQTYIYLILPVNFV